MTALATIRPDGWDLPLFLHILGAMVVVGAAAMALLYLVAAWRGPSSESLRAGFRTLLYVGIPAFIVMRGAAEWLYVKEGFDDLPSEPSWIGIGYGISDLGFLLLLIATVISGLTTRKLGASGGQGVVSPTRIRVSAALCGLMLATYLVAIWAMTTKPG